MFAKNSKAYSVSRPSGWRYLLESLSILSVVIYVLAGWEASGYTCISR